jgi:hypothetical protein
MSAEEQSNPLISRQLRPRRSVLGDISNKISDKLADVAKKVITTKKRKLSVRIYCACVLPFNYGCD